MIQIRKMTGICLAAILGMTTILSVGGCTGESTNGIETELEEGQDVTITWWSFPVFAQESAADAEGTYEQKLIHAFEAVHPEVHVELKLIDFTTGPEKIEHAIENGSACDVLLDAPGRIVDYGKRGYLADLKELFTDEFIADVDNEMLLDACKSGDTAYMYPLSSSPFYMAFNRAMLEDAGVLELVQEGFTTEDFTTVVHALREKGYISGSVFYDGTGGDQGTRAFVSNLYSSAITDRDCQTYTINNEAGLQSLYYMKDAVDEGMLVNGNFQNGSGDIANFTSGQTAFTLLWGLNQQNSNQEMLNLNGIQTVEVPYPSEDGEPELEYLVNGFGVFDNGNQQKIEAAKEFVRFACDDAEYGPKDVIRTGCIPVRQSFGSLYDDARMTQIAGWTKYYTAYYNTMDGYASMRESWQKMLSNLLFDDKTVEDAADDFVKQAMAAMGQEAAE